MLSAAIAAGTSIAGSALSAYQAHQNYKLNKEALSHQKMMDTQGVQVRMKDLAAAGINPILAGQYASGGSAGMSGGLTGGGQELANAGSKVAEMMRAKKETAMLDSQIDVNESQTAKNTAEADSSSALADKLRSETIGLTARNVAAENDSNIEDTWYGRNILSPLRTFVGTGVVPFTAPAINSAVNVKNANTARHNSEWQSGNKVHTPRRSGKK
ncbi:MAG: hypothetical protein LBJ73_02840 [Rickettsiales bacterium]|jgi:hypothetical protein|nr:hypothetical protein [Rickettsiales bacterium]